MKYGIDWYKENATDGGYLNNEIVAGVLLDERDIDIRELKNFNFNARINKINISYNKKINEYYLIVPIYPFRHGNKSILNLIVESDLLYNSFNETIEIPSVYKATRGIVEIILPLKKNIINEKCKLILKYKDSEELFYHEIDRNIEILGNRVDDIMNYISSFNSKKIDNLHSFEVENNYIIQYCYIDYTHGSYGLNVINDVVVYKKEDGVWTSDVVSNPEKYLKSDLDWYYSDERMVDYIEAKGLLPQDKIDAIRAANYEDIFSLEYKIKSTIKIIPIVFVLIIFLIIVIKRIRKRFFI